MENISYQQQNMSIYIDIYVCVCLLAYTVHAYSNILGYNILSNNKMLRELYTPLYNN